MSKTYEDLKQLSDIEICEGTVANAGYCNACTNRNIEKVIVVRLRGLSFRLCTFCKYELLSMMRRLK